MAVEHDESLKAQVREFWNRQSCDTQMAKAPKFSRAYFDQIEAFRYFDQPFIHSFAQFSRYHGRRVLEVGFGAGTDFIQWLRAGARATGLDLTPEALQNLTHRIEAYQLPRPEQIQVGDAENLPFDSDSFDLGYSFGVLMCTPNTEKAIRELARVIRPGGEFKIMLYNRPCIFVLNRWVRFALLRGQPWRSLKWVLWHHVESVGNKGYTRSELVRMLKPLPLEWVQIDTVVTAADYLSASAFWPLNFFYRVCLALAGYRYGWHPSQYLQRVNDRDPQRPPPPSNRRPEDVLLTGNPLGFFHCISARKRG